MRSTAFALVVLRASDPEATLAFYKELGCVFCEERHGSGPLHRSCQLGATGVRPVTPAEFLRILRNR